MKNGFYSYGGTTKVIQGIPCTHLLLGPVEYLSHLERSSEGKKIRPRVLSRRTFPQRYQGPTTLYADLDDYLIRRDNQDQVNSRQILDKSGLISREDTGEAHLQARGLQDWVRRRPIFLARPGLRPHGHGNARASRGEWRQLSSGHRKLQTLALSMLVSARCRGGQRRSTVKSVSKMS